MVLGLVHIIPYLMTALKPYLIGPLFTHKIGDFGAISVTERGCAAPIGRPHEDVDGLFQFWAIVARTTVNSL